MKLRHAVSLAFAVHFAASACAAELDGVSLPETRQLGAATLTLNGAGLRTYSILRLHVYVAGLYLQSRSDDAAAIMASPSPKLITIDFRRAVTAAQARSVWRTDLQESCPAPCALAPTTLEQFLAVVTDAHRDDHIDLFFMPPTMRVVLNGRQIEQTADPALPHLVLAAFIGPHAASSAVRRDLLGAAN